MIHTDPQYLSPVCSRGSHECGVSAWVFCPGRLLVQRQGDPGLSWLLQPLPRHLLSSTVALWPPLLTNRVSYWDRTDEVQGKRDCCECGLCCLLGGFCLGSAGGLGQEVEGRKLKLGGSHSGVQSRVGSWDTVSGQRN